MEQRYRMDLFLKDLSKTTDEEEIIPFYVENEQFIYVGRELHINGKKITYYIWPIEEDSGILFFYIGHNTFDDFMDNIDEYNFDGFTNAYPLLMKALHNGINRNMSDSALLTLRDLNSKDDVYFWCIGTRLENIDISDLDTTYIIKKVIKLYQETIDMFVQLNNNEVSTWDMIKGAGKAVNDGYRKGRTLVNALSIAASIGGTVLGIPGLGNLFSDN